MEEALAIANFVFTAAFTLEMLSKMTGLGAWNYLRDPWNLFDALVVAFSLVELVTELMARTSSGGLSALRCVMTGTGRLEGLGHQRHGAPLPGQGWA